MLTRPVALRPSFCRPATPGASASWLTGVDPTPDPNRIPSPASHPRRGPGWTLLGERPDGTAAIGFVYLVEGEDTPREGPAMPIPWPIDPHKAVWAEEGAGACAGHQSAAVVPRSGSGGRERRAGSKAPIGARIFWLSQSVKLRPEKFVSGGSFLRVKRSHFSHDFLHQRMQVQWSNWGFIL